MEHFITEMIQERKVFAEKEKSKALKKARKVISLLKVLICPFIVRTRCLLFNLTTLNLTTGPYILSCIISSSIREVDRI